MLTFDIATIAIVELLTMIRKIIILSIKLKPRAYAVKPLITHITM